MLPAAASAAAAAAAAACFQTPPPLPIPLPPVFYLVLLSWPMLLLVQRPARRSLAGERILLKLLLPWFEFFQDKSILQRLMHLKVVYC